MKRTSTNPILIATFLALTAAACGGEDDGPKQQPEEGHAFLTIVGDRNVFLTTGQSVTLTVKYHDDDGSPLAGSVRFRIDGDARGASLSKQSGTTNAEGKVTLQLVAGTQGEASFRVIAEAQYANSIDWRAAVAEGVPNALRLEGTYEIESAFDLTSNLQGSVGGSIKDFLAFFDDPTDPFKEILKYIVDEIAGEEQTAVRTAITTTIEIAVVAAISTALPEEFAKLQAFGRDANNMVKRFGLKTKVQIVSGNHNTGEYVANLTVYAITARMEGDEQPSIVKFGDDLGFDDIYIENVPVTRDANNRVVIGQHELSLKFGTLALAVVNGIIINKLAPALSNELNAELKLGAFLATVVRCKASETKPSIGQLIVAKLEEGGTQYDWVGSLVDTFCSVGLSVTAGILITKLNEEGVALGFKLTGSARPVDDDRNGVADKLQSGNWTGEVNVAGTVTPLSADQPFLGIRATP
jgi:hypothetical protein